jgi:hypothetical protein
MNFFRQFIRSRDNVVDIATGYGMDDRGVGVRVAVKNFLSPTSSRSTLGSTQPPILLSPGVKRPGCEADHSPPASAEIKKSVDIYIHYPIRLHGVVLN